MLTYNAAYETVVPTACENKKIEWATQVIFVLKNKTQTPHNIMKWFIFKC